MNSFHQTYSQLSGANVAVIGASGFIGSHLVDSLLFNRCNVLALSRGVPGMISKAAISNKNFRMKSVNMADFVEMQSCLENVDILYHLVSTTNPKTSNLSPQLDVQTNLVGSLNILELCRLQNIKKLVFLSSGGTVYGIPDVVPICENHPTNPLCSYGVTKLAIEKYIFMYRSLYGLDASVLRLANPYGVRQRVEASQGVIPVFLNRALNFKPLEIWGDGSAIRDFVYISDVINAILLSSFHSSPEHIFNIGSGRGLSINDLVGLIEAEVGYKVNTNYHDSRGFDVPSNVLAIDRAKKYLNWEPYISIKEGIAFLSRYLSDSTD